MKLKSKLKTPYELEFELAHTSKESAKMWLSKSVEFIDKLGPDGENDFSLKVELKQNTLEAKLRTR